MDNMSVADIAAVTRNNGYGYGDNYGMGGWWMIILFALIFRNSFWGCNGGGEPVTEAGLCNGLNFNNLQNAVGRLGDQLTNTYTGLQNGLCQIGYQELQNINGLQRDLASGFTATNAAINQARFEAQNCCCETQRAIDQTNYNAAMNTAAINANTTAGIQKILDKMCENETNALRARVNQLELRDAMCGVVRYPTQTTFASPCNPFFGNFGFGNNCGCGCGNI